MTDENRGIRADVPEWGEGAPSPRHRPPYQRLAMSSNALDTLLGVTGSIIVLGLWVAVVALILFNAPAMLVLLLVGMGLVYGWLDFTAREYRRGRRGELLHLLAVASESGAPLAPALNAYLAERPRGSVRAGVLAVLLFLLLPGVYWFWLRHRGFDRLVEELAFRLSAGESLSDALQGAPGVVSSEGQLAAEIGEITGRLTLCLRRAAQEEQSTSWVDPVVRALYMLGLLFLMTGVTTFWATLILPRLHRILQDFNMRMPAVTEQLAAWSGKRDLLISPFLLLLFFFVVGQAVLLSRTIRWYLPIVGSLYRMHLQGRLSRALGLTLEAGMPAPQALALLAESPAFPGPMQSRFEEARLLVGGGAALGPSLQRFGLMPAALVPLTDAAVRAGNLPPTLQAMGHHLSTRASRLLRRASLMLFPAGVLAVGALVGFIVIGMFMPLIEIIEEMTR